MTCEHIRNERVDNRSPSRWCPDCGAIFRPNRYEWELPRANQPAATETGSIESDPRWAARERDTAEVFRQLYNERSAARVAESRLRARIIMFDQQVMPLAHAMKRHLNRVASENDYAMELVEAFDDAVRKYEGDEADPAPQGAPTCDRYPCCKPRKPGSVYCSEHAYWVPNDRPHRPQGAPDPTEEEVAALEKWADSFYGKEWREPRGAPTDVKFADVHVAEFWVGTDSSALRNVETGEIVTREELDRRVVERYSPQGAPQCSDGTRVHDFDGRDACPSCGWKPEFAKLSPDGGEIVNARLVPQGARQLEPGRCAHSGCKHAAGGCAFCPIHCVCPKQDH